MKSLLSIPVLCAGLATLIGVSGLTGCAATSGAQIRARINERPEVFGKLTKQQQKDIKWGYVKRGFTPEMVYFAFGKPEQIMTTPDKSTYAWVYLDHSAINDDLATAIAVKAGGTADSSPGFSSSNANFSGKILTRTHSSSEAYSVTDVMRKQPTIWVAFKNDLVVNVKRMGQKPADKTGSLGG